MPSTLRSRAQDIAVADRTRLLPRRTFTVEVWGDRDQDGILATRVVRLETGESRTWTGWRRSSLLTFLEEQIGGGNSGSARALATHRFGVLQASALVTTPGEVAVRFRLDPADLELPAGLPAEARIELFAQSLTGRLAEPIGARVIDLLVGYRVDLVLRGRPAGRDAPYRVFAVVRILVDQSGERPREGLGAATLELIPAR